MPLDAICLRAVTNELNNVLAGCRVEKVYQPDRDEIVLQTRGGRRSAPTAAVDRGRGLAARAFH